MTQPAEPLKCEACGILVGPSHLEQELKQGLYRGHSPGGKSGRIVWYKPVRRMMCSNCHAFYAKQGIR